MVEVFNPAIGSRGQSRALVCGAPAIAPVGEELWWSLGWVRRMHSLSGARAGALKARSSVCRAPNLWPALDLFSLCLLCHLQVFHYSSFAILTLFMIEVFLKLFVFRLEFFHHKFEILDTFVVVVSFILDLVLLFQKHEFEALGLLILLRLWRVARIINGMAPARGSHRGSAGWVEPGSRPPGPGSISS